MPVAFDTHALITRLTQGQMPVAQAEAVSDALKEALDEAAGQLATQQDLTEVRTALTQDLTTLRTETLREFASVRQDLKHLNTKLTWMIGANWALTLLILGKLLLFKP